MKTLLVLTGHSKGIGKALLQHFLGQDGMQVHALSRTKGQLSHSQLKEWAVDLSDAAAVEAILPDLFPRIVADRYLLINNAGWIGEIKPTGKLQPASLQRALQLNLLTPMLLSNAFAQAYGNSSGQKLICNLSSGAASKPLPGWASYCSSKAGLEMFSRVMDTEWRSEAFRVFSVAPGIVDTDMQQEIRAAHPADFPALARFRDYHTEGMLSPAAAVAEKIGYMLSHPDQFPEVVQDVRQF
jgi:benzil reductase ((S)-benzoin forming)